MQEYEMICVHNFYPACFFSYALKGKMYNSMNIINTDEDVTISNKMNDEELDKDKIKKNVCISKLLISEEQNM